jgi:hypothetical protein
MKKKAKSDSKKSLLISIENLRKLDKVSGGFSCSPTKITQAPCSPSHFG